MEARMVLVTALALFVHAHSAQGRLLKFLPSLPGADPEFDINGPRAKTPSRSIDGPSLTLSGEINDSRGSIVIGPFGMRSKPPPPLSAEGIIGLFEEPKTQKIEKEKEEDDEACKQLLELDGKVYCIVSESENDGVVELLVKEWGVVEASGSLG